MGRKQPTRGADLYSPIFKAFMAHDMTRAQLQEETGISRSACHQCIDDLHAMGLVHTLRIDGQAVVYSARIDADRIKKIAIEARPAAVRFFDMIEALDTPSTISDLVEETQQSRLTVERTIRGLRHHGLCHIASWSRRASGGIPACLWAFGVNKADAPKPRKDTKREINARYAAKQKKRADQIAIQNAICGRQMYAEAA